MLFSTKGTYVGLKSIKGKDGSSYALLQFSIDNEVLDLYCPGFSSGSSDWAHLQQFKPYTLDLEVSRSFNKWSVKLLGAK